MKNTIRCCISCILPCGALDVIRIVHSNGRVEEISGTIKASEIMKAHPKHVLKKPSSPADDGMVPKIVIVPPDAELQRGKIYFLMPVPSTPEKTRSKSSSTTKKKKRESLDNSNSSSNNNNNRNSNGGNGNSHSRQHRHSRSMSNANKNNSISMSNLLISDQYLSEILSEKLSTQRDRRRGRVGVWRPHLESISETPNDA
ncbi:probable serine/threonine-protein kinase DDB_G0288147 [Herrania umbratica]|uniref:Probable serine/threonine-protein kinase DDB_G0288147 n=1 Tax=Herrania umbratica TaxID=108875 RepID=A0A6J1B535_9ROSI|nr:probable serine/threonine-protein kinase DDB_G0288147 [Herrania umbratica]